MGSTDQTSDDSETGTDDAKATGSDDAEAFEINDAADRDEKRGEELQSRFDEEYQGEAWKLNENTEGRND